MIRWLFLYCAAPVLATLILLLSSSVWATQLPKVDSSSDAYDALYAVTFVNDEEGWAVGRNSSILHTKNGGLTWQLQYRDFSTKERIVQSVSFADATHGLAVGSDGLLLRTDSGGDEWFPAARIYNNEAQIGGSEGQHEFLQPGDVSLLQFTKVQYLDRDTAMLFASNQLFFSKSGGRTWTAVSIPQGAIVHDAHFVDVSHGWLAGEGGQLYFTADGGEHWEMRMTPAPWRLSAVYFLDAQIGWVGGEAGLLLATNDGGITWTQIKTWTSEEVAHLVMTSPQKGAVMFADSAIHTADGGTTWSGISLPDGAPEWSSAVPGDVPVPLAVAFVSERRAYAVGSYGMVLSSEDGGASWEQLRSQYLASQEEVELQRSIDYSRFGIHADFGYVHPVGSISTRFGPGMLLGMDFLGRRGRFKFGGGYSMYITSTAETIIAPAGEIKELSPTEVDTSGLLFYVPVLGQVNLFERGRFMMRLLCGVGFVYHGLYLSDAHRSDVGDSNYDRDRIGFGSNQTLIFSWMGVSGNADKVTRGGFYLKVGMQESWTWDVDRAQTDLGHQDTTTFGTELWPYVALGLNVY